MSDEAEPRSFLDDEDLKHLFQLEPRVTSKMRLALPLLFRDFAETPEEILDQPELLSAVAIREIHSVYDLWSSAHESFPERLAAVARQMLTALVDPPSDLEIRVSIMEIEGRRQKPKVTQAEKYEAIRRCQDSKEDDRVSRIIREGLLFPDESTSCRQEHEARQQLLSLAGHVNEHPRVKADLCLRIAKITTEFLSPALFRKSEPREEDPSFRDVGQILDQAWEIAWEIGDVHLQGLVLGAVANASFQMSRQGDSDAEQERLRTAIETGQDALQKIDPSKDPVAHREVASRVRVAANIEFKRENPGSILEYDIDGRLGPGLPMFLGF